MSRVTSAKVEGPDFAKIEARLSRLADDQIRERCLSVIGLGVHNFTEAAIGIKILKARGADLSGFPMVPTFLKIADGKIDPVALFKFHSSPARPLIEILPIDQQKQLARKSTVKGVDPVTGKTRDVDLLGAPADQARVILSPSGVRTPDEQREYLKRQPPPVSRAEAIGHQHSVYLTTEQDTLILEQARARNISVARLIFQVLTDAGIFKPVQPKFRAKAKEAARARAASQ